MTRKTKSTVYLLFVGVALALAAILPAQAISRGYLSDDTGLSPGMVVKVSQTGSADAPKVERATNDQPDRVIGVVTTAEQSTVAIGSAGQSIYVENTGEVEAYVSDINGTVSKGDLLTLSSLNGVLAKYTESYQTVFGLALEDFPPEPVEIHTIQTAEGDKTTGIALIKVNLDQKTPPAKEGGQSVLGRYGEAVVGKQVSEIRVGVALLIFVIVLVSEGAILYGAISSAVSSIGRNPLARKYIKQELLKVVVVALFVLLFGLGSIYLILWV